MSPVFAHGRLRLYLLSLLAVSPMHGYELIQALSERFGGTYSPSAGTVYPRLTKLEEEGLVTKTTEGRKTVYHITDAGRRELEDRERELDEIESEVTDTVRRLADEVRAGVNQAMKSLRADLASAAREARAGAGAGSKGGPGRGPGARAPETDERQRSLLLAREAEAFLTAFRQELRTEIRAHGARAVIPDDFVPQLRERLRVTRDDVLALLRGTRG